MAVGAITLIAGIVAGAGPASAAPGRTAPATSASHVTGAR